MGFYNSVLVKCPRCAAGWLEFQFKPTRGHPDHKCDGCEAAHVQHMRDENVCAVHVMCFRHAPDAIRWTNNTDTCKCGLTMSFPAPEGSA